MKLMMANEMMVIADELFVDDFDKKTFVVKKCVDTLSAVYEAGESGRISKAKYVAFAIVVDKYLPKTTIKFIQNQEDMEKAKKHIDDIMPILMGINDFVIGEGILND